MTTPRPSPAAPDVVTKTTPGAADTHTAVTATIHPKYQYTHTIIDNICQYNNRIYIPGSIIPVNTPEMRLHLIGTETMLLASFQFRLSTGPPRHVYWDIRIHCVHVHAFMSNNEYTVKNGNMSSSRRDPMTGCARGYQKDNIRDRNDRSADYQARTRTRVNFGDEYVLDHNL